MPMFKYDSSLMYAAISKSTDTCLDPLQVGYLNRRTGEIVFLGPEGPAAKAYDQDIAVGVVFDRASIEANPSDWISIPKFDARRDGMWNEDRFIADFLEAHGVSCKSA